MIGELVFPNLAYQRALKKALAVADVASSSGTIVKELWQQYGRIRSDIPRAYPPQTRFLLKLAARNVALYRVMSARDADRHLVNDLLAKVNWSLSKNLGKPLSLISRIVGKVAQTRLLFIDTLLYRVLFIRPFQRTILSRTPHLAFIITVCPFAQFYRSQNALAICQFAACDLDHEMARAWNVRFERTTTIAAGGEYCDFKFTASR